ncbi:MAG: hypothetical protein U0229_10970 [Anaeromyxobacter sp.]
MTGRRLLAALALVAAGPSCVLLDDRTLVVRPADVLFAGATGDVDHDLEPVLELEARTTAARVELLLDGVRVGDHPANGKIRQAFPFSPDVGGPATGEHRLTVREVGVARPKEVTLPFEFFPTRPAVVPSPPEGYAPLDTRTLRLRFEHAPLASRLGADDIRLELDGVPSGGPRVEGDGTVLAFDLPAPLAAYGTVAVVYPPARLFGARSDRVVRHTWTGALVDATISHEGPDLVSGKVLLGVAWSGRFPGAVELRAGERVIATLGPAPPTLPVEWDTTGVPEGTYPLSLAAEGYRFRYTPAPPTLVVANAPAEGITCSTPTGDVRPLADVCVTVVPPAKVTIVDGSFEVAGRTTAAAISGDRACSSLARDVRSFWEPLVAPAFEPPDLGGTATFTATLRTAAGVTGTASCALAWPAWRAPLPDPLPGPVAAREVSLIGESGTCGLLPGLCLGADDGLLLTVGAGAEAGRVRAWALTGAGWTPGSFLDAGGAAAASSLAGDLWVERTGGGAGRLRQAQLLPDLNLDPAADADEPAVSPGSTAAGQYAARAWTEAQASGRAVVAYGKVVPRLDPAAVASQPAVAAPPALFAAGPYDSTFAAWIERPAGGVAVVRAATLSPSLDPVVFEGVTNADPAVDAAEPTVFAAKGIAIVAWREGGRLLARVVTASGVGDPEVLNADPARAARRPRFDTDGRAPTLYWLEADAGGGEAIRVRRYTGSSWLLYPQAVNGPAPGVVASYAVDAHRVAWVDGAGGVHLRVAGFPR